MRRAQTESHKRPIQLHPRSDTMLRKSEVAQRLGVSTFTLDRWLVAGQFPAPIYLQSGSPARWRWRDIEAFIEKRRSTRRPRPKLRGAAAERHARAVRGDRGDA